jgi:MFS family permease
VTGAVWLRSPSLSLFLVGGAVTGVGAGLLFKATLSTVVELAPAENRAEALAGFFLASYIGLSLPVIGLGVAAALMPMRDALLGFATLAVVGNLAAAAAALRAPRLRPLAD